MGGNAAADGPDFSCGIRLADHSDEGTIVGRVGDEPVLLTRIEQEWFAVSGTCTHYGAALGDGLISANEVRCPLHHACFDLKSGAVLRAPALDPLNRWRIDIEGDHLFVREKLKRERSAPDLHTDIQRIVIVGGGAAGFACANRLRALGYGGDITILSADGDPPCDRPNLSKDYLAGTAPEEWIPLRGEDWYREQRIELRLNTVVRAIDTSERTVTLGSGECLPFERLLLAMGSEPRRLEEQGLKGENVLTLRSLSDARAIIERIRPGSNVAIIGSSFIGLEAAAALRTRGANVTIVSPEHIPFERLFGPEIGQFVQKLHENHGCKFHLGTVAARFESPALMLADGSRITADLVLVGVGVTPRTSIAQAAGLEVDNGIWVDKHLETSCSGIFAAGDIAAYPDRLTGDRVRIEHWAVAERQGELAAANMLGLSLQFDSAPFFWTEQYGVSIRYVGHASDWDEARVDGDITTDRWLVRYYQRGKHLASASINRNRESLEDEIRIEEAMRTNG